MMLAHRTPVEQGLRTSQSEFVESLLIGLRRVNGVVLRNYAELPFHIGNDLDILIEANLQGMGERILMDSAVSQEYSLINRAEFSPVSLFIAHNRTRHQLHIDLFTGLRWRGLDILRPELVLTACQDRGLFFVPHPVHEATLNLLTRLLYHGYVKEKYKEGIQAAYRAHPDEARHTLAEPIGVRAARDLVGYVLDADWSTIEAAANRWRRLLVSHRLSRYPQRTLSFVLSDVRRLIRRFIQPPGIMLVLLGPDGCGKSSVASGIMEALTPTFGKEKSLHLHWKPSLLRRDRPNAGPVTDPHAKPPRGPLVSLAYFTFHLLEFVLGGQLRIRPVLFRNGLVAIDRYYYDFLVDPKRYRLTVPRRLLKWAYRFVMKPDLVFCLDAPPEVLQRRKQEVSPEETARQRDAYLELAHTLPNAHVVDASRPLDEVVAEVEKLVLEYMAVRTARRLGLTEP